MLWESHWMCFLSRMPNLPHQRQWRARSLRPRNVEYTSPEPAGFSFVTKAEPFASIVVWNASGVVGKVLAPVNPVALGRPTSVQCDADGCITIANGWR